MSVFPNLQDSDSELPRIDDNISELGQDAINAIRDAIFAIEANLGINAQGSQSSVVNRLNVSLNADGTIKASALTSIGLATLPITNVMVANNAGIAEYKLALDFSTSDLHTLFLSNTALINSLVSFTAVLETNNV